MYIHTQWSMMFKFFIQKLYANFLVLSGDSRTFLLLRPRPRPWPWPWPCPRPRPRPRPRFRIAIVLVPSSSSDSMWIASNSLSNWSASSSSIEERGDISRTARPGHGSTLYSQPSIGSRSCISRVFPTRFSLNTNDDSTFLASSIKDAASRFNRIAVRWYTVSGVLYWILLSNIKFKSAWY